MVGGEAGEGRARVAWRRALSGGGRPRREGWGAAATRGRHGMRFGDGGIGLANSAEDL